MAEVAGLALGVVGLAGVIGAFKDVIDLFSLFLDSRHLGRDFEVLDTKLDIEKAVLLQWADRVGLLRQNHSPQLDNPDTRATVYRALSSIQSLLRDVDTLKSRYGVDAVNVKDLKSLAQENESKGLLSRSRIGSAAISAIQMTHFTTEFDKMDLRMKSLQERSGILKQKIRWVIRDKESFEMLLSQLTHFITRLGDLIPTANMSYATATDAITDSSLQASLDLRGLKIVLEASQGARKAVADSARRAIDGICQEKILQKLWFRTIASREENIGDAHGETLQWLFEPPKEEVPWDDLGNWFRTGSGLYWVSGKAGSGKSTLMKLLYHSPRTKVALAKWAGEGGYALFGFFFWNLGTTEQKSQQGLSRSLLYQILSSNPSLIPEVLPSMWKELIEKETDVSLPSPSESRLAFRILSGKSTELGKFCFLIDGLDEFAGDYREGIAFIEELTTNPGFKVLVSSRPIPDCVSAFDGMPKLHLHQLTRDDITAYVHDVVVKHKYMQKLMVRNRTEALGLVEELVEKSSGVFLWVILACRSLLSGFSDYDRIAELRQRMDELPPELEDMFKHMLNRIEVRHRRQGARLLRLCFEFRKHGSSAMIALGLAFIDDNQEPAAYRRLLPIEEKRDSCEELVGRLRSRCGGLLELTQRRNLRVGFLDRHKPCFCSASKGSHHDPIVDGKVEFMHRTVFEFLDQEGVWEFDCLQMSPNHSSIASELSLYGLFLAMQCLCLEDGRRARLYLWQGLDWGVRADDWDPKARDHIFWKMQSFLDTLFGVNVTLPILNSLAQMDFHSRGNEYFSHATLMLAIEAGAINYVKAHPELATFRGKGEPTCGCDSIWSLVGSRKFRPQDMDLPDDSKLATDRVYHFLHGTRAPSRPASCSVSDSEDSEDEVESSDDTSQRQEGTRSKSRRRRRDSNTSRLMLPKRQRRD